MWVAESNVTRLQYKLYAYALDGGARQSGKDFNTVKAVSTGDLYGIWSDGDTMWVVDQGVDEKIYSFNMPPSAPASTDATLSGLVLSDGTLWPEFAAATTEYRAAVANGVAQVTVTAATADSGATVLYLDGSDAALPDADTGADGQQVNAAVGLTTFKVKVTAADTTTTQTYTVVIERDSAGAYGWTPTRDLSGSLYFASNNNARGIWSDGTAIWVSDRGSDKLYAYALSGGARDATKEFNLHADNANPEGIWSDGNTIWVADSNQDKLYAYALSDGTRDEDKEFALDAGNGDPRGIWSDGTTIWVSDDSRGKLHAYTLDTGARDERLRNSPCTPTTSTPWASGPTGSSSGWPTPAKTSSTPTPLATGRAKPTGTSIPWPALEGSASKACPETSGPTGQPCGWSNPVSSDRPGFTPSTCRRRRRPPTPP